MEKTIEVMKKISEGFPPEFEINDHSDPLDGEVYYSGEFYDIMDDTERQQLMTNVSVNTTGEVVQKVLTKLFGEPKIQPNGVLNWTVNGVLIVVQGNDIETYEEYQIA